MSRSAQRSGSGEAGLGGAASAGLGDAPGVCCTSWCSPTRWRESLEVVTVSDTTDFWAFFAFLVRFPALELAGKPSLRQKAHLGFGVQLWRASRRR
jgi:hypothetical protein